METTNFIKEEIIIGGKHKRQITLDVNYFKHTLNQPIIIFCHGFKGFKDWGAFNVMAKTFASNNFFFTKLNFSHNGTTVDDFSDIHDLEAFGHNNFEIELDDLGNVIDWLGSDENRFKENINMNELYLLGHSRGGGIAMLKTIEDVRVKKVVVWGTVNDFEKYMYMNDPLIWKETGVSYVENSRTGIKLPLYYQFYENYYNNLSRFDIKNNLMKLDRPILLLHGTKDSTVPLEDAIWIYDNLDHSILIKIEDGDHTFGAKHPWESNILPENMTFAIEESVAFFAF